MQRPAFQCVFMRVPWLVTSPALSRPIPLRLSEMALATPSVRNAEVTSSSLVPSTNLRSRWDQVESYGWQAHPLSLGSSRELRSAGSPALAGSSRELRLAGSPALSIRH